MVILWKVRIPHPQPSAAPKLTDLSPSICYLEHYSLKQARFRPCFNLNQKLYKRGELVRIPFALLINLIKSLTYCNAYAIIVLN